MRGPGPGLIRLQGVSDYQGGRDRCVRADGRRRCAAAVDAADGLTLVGALRPRRRPRRPRRRRRGGRVLRAGRLARPTCAHCVDRGVHVVVGTTGWDDERGWRRCAAQAGGAARRRGPDRPQLRHRRDPDDVASPSRRPGSTSRSRWSSCTTRTRSTPPRGTAARTARLIGRGPARRPASATCPTRRRPTPVAPAGRRVDGVPVHSVRLRGLVAHQEVLFGATGELLTIRHDSFDRALVHARACSRASGRWRRTPASRSGSSTTSGWPDGARTSARAGHRAGPVRRPGVLLRHHRLARGAAGPATAGSCRCCWVSRCILLPLVTLAADLAAGRVRPRRLGDDGAAALGRRRRGPRDGVWRGHLELAEQHRQRKDRQGEQREYRAAVRAWRASLGPSPEGARRAQPSDTRSGGGRARRRARRPRGTAPAARARRRPRPGARRARRGRTSRRWW